MSKHVWLWLIDMPDSCSVRERQEKINKARFDEFQKEGVSREEILQMQEHASDIRECFYCEHFSGVRTGEGGPKDKRQRSVLMCRLKDEVEYDPRIRITVE